MKTCSGQIPIGAGTTWRKCGKPAKWVAIKGDQKSFRCPTHIMHLRKQRDVEVRPFSASEERS